MLVERTHPGHTRRTGFTLVELLVVIVIIGLLVGLVAAVGGQVMYVQKVRATENTMRGITMAIDQFSAINPLAAKYDSRMGRSFGPHPPYQVEGRNSAGYVGGALDPSYYATLAARLVADGGDFPGAGLSLHDDDVRNNDNRALYTYLAVLTPNVLTQVPEQAVKPLLPERDPEYINLGGTVEDRVPILGFHDAWGVPMDYFLYVKLGWGVQPASGLLGWKVTNRVPALRSWGIAREEYDSLLAAGETGEPGDWIFSTPFPTPASTGVNPETGAITSQNPEHTGWARAVAEGDDYQYVP